MHARLRQWIPALARIEVCEATDDDPARPPDRRRKPEPGMLWDAAAALGLDLARSWMVGDRWRDVDCGRRAGVRTVFIDFHYAEPLRAAPDFRVSSFAEAARIILARRQP
jgi:D-glycero-D-manno-heptose 1,7-bisphosphate phosphatase